MESAPAAVLERIGAAASAARRARRGRDPEEDLHRFRVAARRLLAALKLIEKPCSLPRGPRRILRGALRATSSLRDRHILDAWLRKRAGRPAPLGRALAAARAPATDVRWDAVEAALERLGANVGSARPKAARLKAARTKAVKKLSRRLRRRLGSLGRAPRSRTLHRARIATKALRYLLEAAGTDARAAPSPRSLRRLQSSLGEVRDREMIAAAVSEIEGIRGLRAPARKALETLNQERRDWLERALRRRKTVLLELGSA